MPSSSSLALTAVTLRRLLVHQHQHQHQHHPTCWRAAGCLTTTPPRQLLSSSSASSSSAGALLTLAERRPPDSGGASYTLTMNSPPANTFTSAFLQQFIDAVYRLSEQSKPAAVRSLVIKSALPTIFSSGFDLDELSNPASREQLTDFLKLFRQAFYCLYTAPFYTIAQISGHAPAGGCALALACDHRIVLDKDSIKIGLTPTKVGITPPAWLTRLAESRFVSSHACERALLQAQLFTPRQAVAVGLADAATTPGGTLDELEQLVADQLVLVHSADAAAVSQVRALFTRQVLGLMSDADDLAGFVDCVLSDQCQALLAKARLGSKGG